MINWKRSSSPPDTPRQVVGLWLNPIGDDSLETIRHDTCGWYDAHENTTDIPDYWCELSELNLPVGGDA